MIKSFLRWSPPPLALVAEGFTLPDDQPQAIFGYCDETSPEYALPIKRGDQIRFLTENPGDMGKIGLIRNGEVVTLDAGTVESEALEAPWQVTLNVPVDLEDGCYQVVLFRVPILWNDWEETDRVCEISPTGTNTGFSLVTEERTGTEGAPLAIAVSNFLVVGDHPETKIIRFSDSRLAFGFNYPAAAGFYQQVRLHLYVNKPTYPIKEKVYRQSNGVFRTANVVIDKKLEVTTGYVDELTQAALAVAVKHSSFFINGRPLSVQGELETEFFETFAERDGFHPYYITKFEAFEQGYNQTNFGCGTDPAVDVSYTCSPLRYAYQAEGAQASEEVVAIVTGQPAEVVYSFFPIAEQIQFSVTGRLPAGLALRSDCGQIILSGTSTTDDSRIITIKARTEEGYCLELDLTIVSAPAAEEARIFDFTFDDTFN